MLKDKVVIAVDFDGTVSNERDMGPVITMKENAKEILTKWFEEGHVLILWTCRHGNAFEEACNFLVENDMLHLFSAFNDQLPEIREKYYPDVARKVGADFYVDDRNLESNGIDWIQLDKQLQKRIKELKLDVRMERRTS